MYNMSDRDMATPMNHQKMPEANDENLIARHIPRTAEALRALERELARLCAFIEGAPPRESALRAPTTRIGPAVVYERRNDGRFRTVREAPALVRITQAYRQITYRGDEEPNRSIAVYGALGTPHHVIDQARRVNAAKATFRAAIAAIPRQSIRVAPPRPGERPGTETRWLRTAVLARIESARINTLAAGREIPLIEEPIRLLAHREAITRSVPRRTVASLARELSVEPGVRAVADLARLATLEPTEYLVGPKRHYRRMRAQATPVLRARAQITVCADLPILFLVTARHEILTLRAPNATRTQPRERRSLMEPEPFIETLGFHRMQEPYRRYATRNEQDP